MAPNDNNNVNVFKLGDDIAVLSDTPSFVTMDAATLNTTHEYNAMGCHTPFPCTKIANMTTPLMELGVGGSAHPFKMENGDYLSLLETGKVMGSFPPGPENMVIYRISGQRANEVEEIVKIPVPKASYAHSFGLAQGEEGPHAVVITQPLHYNMMGILETGTLQAGFENFPDENTTLYVAPVKAGAKAMAFTVPKFYFGHVVNTFSDGNGKFTIDINTQDDIFFDRYSLDVQRNKTRRDSWPTTVTSNGKPGYETVTRYVLDTKTNSATHSPLFGVESQRNIFNEHDLFKIHPADLGKPYCGYWAWQAFYKSDSFASWAVVRTELCGDKPKVAAAWYKANVYPGEATFVPKPGSADKTEGVLLFKALDGNTGKTLLLVVDAKSMETISEAVLPVHIPFTVHGDWFPTA